MLTIIIIHHWNVHKIYRYIHRKIIVHGLCEYLYKNTYMREIQRIQPWVVYTTTNQPFSNYMHKMKKLIMVATAPLTWVWKMKWSGEWISVYIIWAACVASSQTRITIAPPFHPYIAFSRFYVVCLLAVLFVPH